MEKLEFVALTVLLVAYFAARLVGERKQLEVLERLERWAREAR